MTIDRRKAGSEQAILSASPAEQVSLYNTEAGDYTLEWQGVLLHHAGGAALEAKAVCAPKSNMFHPGTRSNHILMGLGLGYLLEEVYQNSPGKIFIYEPNVSLLRFVLENVDLSEYLGSQRVYLATDLATFRQQMRSRYIVGENVDVLMTQGYATLMAKEVPSIMESLLKLAEDQKANIGIGMTYHLDWVEHFIWNLAYLPQCRPFSGLQKVFQDKPALVISAGPSLDLAIETIKQHPNHFVVIAVGAALRALLKQDIEPDFVVFLDFQGPKEQLTDLPSEPKTSRFIISPFVGTSVFKHPNAGCLMTPLANYSTFSDILDDLFYQSPIRVEAGATVSVMALECARAMGCNPVILTGQDLAIKGTQLYAGGVNAEIDEEGYLSTEQSDVMVARRMKLMRVKGQSGEELWTTPDYYDYKQHLEELAEAMHRDQPGLKLWNASVGGAWIQGFEHGSLTQAIEQIQLKAFDKETVLVGWDTGISSLPNAQQIQKKVQAFLKGLEIQLKELINVASHLTALLERIIQTPKNSWHTLETTDLPQYRQLRQNYSQLLSQSPFIEYALKKEIWDLQESFNLDAKSPEEMFQNLQADARYFKSVGQLLSDKILPLIQSAIC